MVDVLAFLSYENYASLSYLEIIKQRFKKCIYRKIPKISPSVYKPPKLVAQKTSVKSPVQIYIYKPSGGLYSEIALKYKVKQGKNIKFPSNYKASPIDFETLISLHR